ncbi:MAG: tail fiber domain-containing protein [Deltaproteobacteria bacterium]|nr:tail fiber domain-containing protein [Deltaproteobacteria bacterium]
MDQNMVARWRGTYLTGGSMYNLDNGNVGIGVPNPGEKLVVNGNAAVGGNIYIERQGLIQSLGQIVDNQLVQPFLRLLAYNPAIMLHPTTSPWFTLLVPPKGGFIVADSLPSRENLHLHEDGSLWVYNGYSTSSDDRLKVNQQRLEYGLAQVMALEPQRYDLLSPEYDPTTKELFFNPEKIVSTNRIGLVAQDVHKVIPEAVTAPGDEKKALWSISYDDIIPVLIKALQEQQAQIEQLKNEIQTIKAGTQ